VKISAACCFPPTLFKIQQLFQEAVIPGGFKLASHSISFRCEESEHSPVPSLSNLNTNKPMTFGIFRSSLKSPAGLARELK